MHILNIPLILVTLLKLHLDISGKDDKKKQSSNAFPISLTLLVFQLDKSGNDVNIVKKLNNPCILVILSIFHLDISGINDSDSQKKITLLN